MLLIVSLALAYLVHSFAHYDNAVQRRARIYTVLTTVNDCCMCALTSTTDSFSLKIRLGVLEPKHQAQQHLPYCPAYQLFFVHVIY